MEATIQELVSQWRGFYQQRLELEKLAERIKKEKEIEAMRRVLEYLDLHDQDGVKLANGGGTVSKRVTTHVRLQDAEVACRYMFERMREADANGTPLMDNLIFQKTPLKTDNLKWAEDKLRADNRPIDVNTINEVIGELGLKVYTEVGLSYTKK
jgi:hypothetical protein